MLVVLKTVCLFGGIFTAGTILSGGIYSIIPTIQKHFEKEEEILKDEEDLKTPELLLQTPNTENIQQPQTETIQDQIPTQDEQLPIINEQEAAKAEEQRKINDAKLQLKTKNTDLVATLGKQVSQLSTTIQTKKSEIEQVAKQVATNKALITQLNQQKVQKEQALSLAEQQKKAKETEYNTTVAEIEKLKTVLKDAGMEQTAIDALLVEKTN